MSNFEITINIKAEGIVNAIMSLVQVFKNQQGSVEPQAIPQPVAPVQQPQAQQPQQPQQPQPQPVSNIPMTPMGQASIQQMPVTQSQQQYPQQAQAQQAQAQQTGVPITSPTYTLEQLSVAAAPLADAGRGAELISLMQSYGCSALTQLPRELYGTVATQLRAMGARI